MSEILVDTIKTSGGSGGITVPTETGTLLTTGSSISSSNIDGSLGKVLQVVNFVTTEQGSVTLTAYTASQSFSPAISKSITPLKNNSSFLVQARWNGEMVYGLTWNSTFNITRNGSNVNAPNTDEHGGIQAPNISYMGDNNDSTAEGVFTSILDTTGSTAGTAITYELTLSNNRVASTVYTNRQYNASSVSGTTSYENYSCEIIIMEIGA